LDDEDVGSGLFGMASFVGGRHGLHDDGACASQPLNRQGIGDAEGEADHGHRR
jgi:hypothetical protein